MIVRNLVSESGMRTMATLAPYFEELMSRSSFPSASKEGGRRRRGGKEQEGRKEETASEGMEEASGSLAARTSEPTSSHTLRTQGGNF